MPQRRPTARPRLHALEDRCVPAVVLSDNLGNATGPGLIGFGDRYLAADFLTDGAAHTLTSVTLDFAVTGAAPVVRLYSDAGLRPGTALTTLAVASPVSNVPADTTFSSPDGFALTPNTRYWVVASSGAGSATIVTWQQTPDTSGTPAGTFQGNFAVSDDAGAAWTVGDQAPFLLRVTADEGDRPGTVSFTAAAFSAPEAGGGLPVTLTRTVGGPAVSVTVSAVSRFGEETAAAGPDYAGGGYTATFAAGATTASVTIPLLDDAVGEGDETFRLELGGPTGGAGLGTPAAATATITDDEAPQPGVIEFARPEFGTREGRLIFSADLRRTGGTAGEVSVTVSAVGGTATPGVDYALRLPRTFTFRPGQDVVAVALQVEDDALVEGTETTVLELSAPTGGATVGAQATATGTIQDNDFPPPPAGFVGFGDFDFEVTEGGPALVLTLVRTAASAGAVSVTVRAVTANDDLLGLPATVEFADGQTTASLTVPLVDDTVFEERETIRLELTDPTGGAVLGPQTAADVFVTDNDQSPPPAGLIGFAAVDILSAAEGGPPLVLTLVRTGGTAGVVRVTVLPSFATADLLGLPATVEFADGQTTASVPLTVADDSLFEGSESVRLELADPTGGASLGQQRVVLISLDDNDAAPPPPDQTVPVVFAPVSLFAGETSTPVTFTLRRTDGGRGPLEVAITPGGTATAGADYSGLPRTVTFADGQLTALGGVVLLDDREIEGPETLTLTAGGSTATLDILDREPLVAVGSGAGATAALLSGGSVVRTVQAFDAGVTGGVRVASADLTGDGVDDLVAGSGPGTASEVRVFDGRTGALIASVRPFEASFLGGVFVAAADLDGDGRAEVVVTPDGDGRAEVVVTPDEGGGPVVAVYTAALTEITRFFGIEDPNFRGGARPALGDLSGDGRADLIVSAGFQGGPRVALYDGATLAAGRPPAKLRADFFAFEEGLRNGAFVAAGDFDGDGRADLLAGGGPGGGPRVRVVSGPALLAAGAFTNLDEVAGATQVANFFAGDPAARGGVPLGVGDLTGDGADDLLAADRSAAARVRGYSAAAVRGRADAAVVDLPGGFGGGVFVG